MMSELFQQQAADFVTGALPPAERDGFLAELTRDPQLAAEVADLENTYAQLARLAPPIELPPGLRERTLMAATTGGTGAKIIPITHPARPRRVAILPWLATGLAAVTAFLLWVDAREQRTRAMLATEKAEAAELVRDRLAQEAGELRGTLARSASAAANNASDLQRLRSENQRTTEALRQAEQRAEVARLQVVTLSSKLDARYLASVAWDAERQTGILQISHLPARQPATEYKLWVIDAVTGQPKGAGTFRLDADGRARLTFQPDSTVGRASAFAVSLEKAENVSAPAPKGPIFLSGSGA